MMKYFYKPKNTIRIFGLTYTSLNSLYRTATLYLIRGKGICVVQKRYDPVSKSFYWSELDPGLANDIFMAPGFIEYFRAHATEGEYYTVSARKIMWSLRMKPLEKEWWEVDI